jgi:flagellar motor switch protein FliN/FliY
MTATEEIAHFLDVSLEVNVELDRRIMTIRDVLELDVENVLKLTKSAGENLDVRLGGALIGSGEIVVLEAITGIRITDFKLED